MRSDEIFDLAWSSCIQVIAPNEVGGEIVSRRMRFLEPIDERF